MKVLTPEGRLLRHNSWKSLSPGDGRHGPTPWGANSFPKTLALRELSGSDGDHYFPAPPPGWYLTASWVNMQGQELTYVWGDGQAISAALTLSAYYNDPSDPLLPTARNWSRGLVGPAVIIALWHGKGAGR